MMNNTIICTVLKKLLDLRGSKTMLCRVARTHEPFRVLISAILSARAKDEVTGVVAKELFMRYPDARSLANADTEGVIKIIRRIGFFNAKSRNIINTAKLLVEKYNGKVPRKLEQLLGFPGVGRKVANCVLVYAFGIAAIPVDVHVHQVANRLGWVKTKTPGETERALERLVQAKHWLIVNEAFVSHGRSICVSVSPFCSKCPIYDYCRRIGVKRQR